MTDENTNNTNETPGTDLPPAPNGHSANGAATSGDTEGSTDTKPSGPSGPSGKKKKKRDKDHPHGASPTPQALHQDPPSGAAASAESTPPSVDPLPAAAESTPPSVDPPTVTPTVTGLRLRLKVWTDQKTAKRYLLPTAFFRDVVNGQPMSDVMYGYAIGDTVQRVLLTASEWQALPFYYFQEDGPAPRPTNA